MTSRAATEYRYEKLTWPEIDDAVELGKVCILPCGAVEQHGPHLPLDVDLVCPGGIACGAGQGMLDLAEAIETLQKAKGLVQQTLLEPRDGRAPRENA